MTASTYTVALDNFEGPLDLLLHLIERRELQVTDVSVSQVTGDYIAFVSALEKAETQNLRWFLDIGTRLLSFKSRALGMPIEDDDEPGTLDDLTEQLRYLQKIRKAARRLQIRSTPAYERTEPAWFWQSLPPANVSLQDLARVASVLAERRREKPVPKHTVKITRIDIGATIQSMLRQVTGRSHVISTVRHRTRRQTVAQVLALLELIRRDVWELIEMQGEPHVQPKTS